MTKVSIIIATHNRPHLLSRAIGSALSAATEPEIIVVDDASSGAETISVCHCFSGIRYVRVDRNQGLGGARNLGIMASGGDYISFLDDDDIRLPESLDVQIKALESAPEVGLVYGRALIGDQNVIPTDRSYPDSCPQGDVFWELLEWNFIPCPTVVFRKSCLYRVGLLDEEIPGVEDWDLWIRIAELYKVAAVEQPVAIWRQSTPTSGQYTSRAAEMLILCERLLRRRWFALPRAASASPDKRRETRRRFLNHVSDQLMWETASALKSGHLLRARKSVLAALRLHPEGAARRAVRVATLRSFLTGMLANRKLRKPMHLEQGEVGE